MGQLNKDQQQAVETTDVPSVVLACPGSGKTSVVTAKVAHILQTNPSAYICCTTFSKEGAEEMKSRVLRMAPVEKHGQITVSTFHSLCYNQLKEIYGQPNIIREFERRHVVHKVMNELGIHIEESEALSIIDQLPTMADSSDIGDQWKDAYNRYREILYAEGKTDFNGLIVDTVNLLESGDITPKPYTHLICDEQQDSDILMYRWISAHIRNGTVPTFMLDDDQTLYSFRNSLGVQISRSAQSDFDAAVIRMGTNYRSNKEILEPSEKLIKNNLNREDKALLSHKGEGGSFNFHGTHDQFTARDLIQGLVCDSPEDWFILCRTNADLLLVSTHLIDCEIPHTLPSGKSIFDNPAVTKYLNLLSHIDNPTELTSEIILKGILHNRDTFNQLTCDSSSIRDVLESQDLNGMIPEDVYSRLCDLRRKIVAWNGMIEAKRVSAVCRQVGRHAAKYEFNPTNVELIEYATRLIAASFVGSLNQRLNATSNNKKQDDGEGVTLLTAHSSKGLEKKNVLIWNVCEGSFPADPDEYDDDSAHFEEERRVLYVAMTRAETNLHLVFQRRKLGVRRDTIYEPSRYLIDLGMNPQDVVDDIQEQAAKVMGERAAIKQSTIVN